MARKLGLLFILLFTGTAVAQQVLPVSTENILVFIEPFADQGLDHSQAWLNQGLPGFLRSGLQETPHVRPYLIPAFDARLLDRPHKLQDLIWKSVFHRQVNYGYETYLILGGFDYLEGKLTVRMDLLSLENTRVWAHFEDTLSYPELLSWKDRLPTWVVTQLRLARDASATAPAGLPSLTVDTPTSRPKTSLKDQLTTLFSAGQEQTTADLSKPVAEQSRLKLGVQLEKLWHDITYDPYLAEIHDIHSRRLQYEPDSIQITFRVSYRINPRILDEIEYFSKTRSGLVEQTESFQGHTFMDLGYIDADFTKELAGGDWRIVPVITMGPEGYTGRRVFYHSFPNPIEPPGKNYYNQGQFKQLLMAIPGVDALRIFAQDRQEDYEYSVTVGYDELKKLDKIQVKFIREQDLVNQL